MATKHTFTIRPNDASKKPYKVTEAKLRTLLKGQSKHPVKTIDGMKHNPGDSVFIAQGQLSCTVNED